jgi:large subunit ribosomal protein L24
MARAHVKKDDLVAVISGADKGKRGKVLVVDREKGRVIVEGINRRKRTVRRSAESPEGGITEKECPIHVSNVMIADKYDARRKAGAGASDATQQDKDTD